MEASKVWGFTRAIAIAMIFVSCAFPGASAGGERQGAFLAIGSGQKTLFELPNAGMINILYSDDSGVNTNGNHIIHQNTPGAEDEIEADDYFGIRLVSGDFNGDGLGDLAVGIPDEDIGDVMSAGAVQVFYGVEHGLTCTEIADQFIDEELLPNTYPHFYNRFGLGLAAADFNGDGFDDLAIGIPGYPGFEIEFAGIVVILDGSSAGLITEEFDWFWQDTDGIGGVAESNDQFGASLAAGDFNRDGFADLVVGVNLEDIGDEINAGCIHVIYGSGSGLTSAGSQIFWQGKDNIKEIAEAGDYFGGPLCTGDFNGDGFDDIAIAAVGENLSFSASDAGAISVLFGSSSGITTVNNLFLSVHDPVTGDTMGTGLAAGDLNGDGYDDLIVGVPGRDSASIENSGEILVYFGRSDGLSETIYESHYQGDGIIPDTREVNDEFGKKIVCGDLNDDGYDDLAINARRETLETPSLIPNAGMVAVVYGSATGIASAGAQVWTLDSEGVDGSAAAGDHLGTALAIGYGDFVMQGCNETGVTLWMPAHTFAPGDPCALTATVCNAGVLSLIHLPLFVVLEIAGVYYFAPSFGGYDNYADQYSSFPVGKTEVVVLPEFSWPENVAAFGSGCMLYGVMTDPEITSFVGEMDLWFFNWTD